MVNNIEDIISEDKESVMLPLIYPDESINEEDNPPPRQL